MWMMDAHTALLRFELTQLTTYLKQILRLSFTQKHQETQWRRSLTSCSQTADWSLVHNAANVEFYSNPSIHQSVSPSTSLSIHRSAISDILSFFPSICQSINFSIQCSVWLSIIFSVIQSIVFFYVYSFCHFIILFSVCFNTQTLRPRVILMMHSLSRSSKSDLRVLMCCESETTIIWGRRRSLLDKGLKN